MSSRWQDRVIAEFKRDWRRTGVLVVLTILALVLGIRQFATSDPAEARAGGDVVAQAAAPGVASVAQAPGTGNAGLTPAIWVDPGDGRQSPIPELTRDPFRVDFKHFPRDPNGAADDGPSRLDPDQARRARESAIRAEVESLNLQTVLMSNPPSVMINSRIYRVGQQVWARQPGDVPAGAPKVTPFLLTAVSPTSVTLEKEGFEVILTLK